MIIQSELPAVFSIAYLPPISFFVKACQCNSILIEQYENYNRQTYRNRCLIPGPNGIQALSIPLLQHHGEKVPIRNILIDNREPWQRLHWRSITTAYNNSPFFLYYMDALAPFYEDIFDNLFDFNHRLLVIVSQLIGLKRNVHFTDKFNLPGFYPNDFRYQLTPKKKVDFPLPRYTQVFSDRFPFAPDMSIIDLLFNEGPSAIDLIMEA